MTGTIARTVPVPRAYALEDRLLTHATMQEERLHQPLRLRDLAAMAREVDLIGRSWRRARAAI